MIKDGDSLYTPGSRGGSWIKFKKELATLEVVVVGVEEGHGKRSHLLSDYTRRQEVDDALERIGDKSLLAEVARFRGTMDALERLQREIREHEEQLYCVGNDNRKCVCRLERAQVLARIFEEEEVANGLRLITPWVVERRRQDLERGRSG